MTGRSHLPAPERRAVARLHELLSTPGLVHGSLRVNRRRCGKARCACASGARHESSTLAVLVKGRQVSLHVPADWEARVRDWLERDREVRAILLELSAMYAHRLRSRKE